MRKITPILTFILKEPLGIHPDVPDFPDVSTIRKLVQKYFRQRIQELLFPHCSCVIWKIGIFLCGKCKREYNSSNIHTCFLGCDGCQEQRPVSPLQSLRNWLKLPSLDISEAVSLFESNEERNLALHVWHILNYTKLVQTAWHTIIVSSQYTIACKIHNNDNAS